MRLVMVGLFSVCQFTRPSAAKWVDRKLMRIETNVNQAKPGNVQSQLSGLFGRCCSGAPIKFEKQE